MPLKNAPVVACKETHRFIRIINFPLNQGFVGIDVITTLGNGGERKLCYLILDRSELILMLQGQVRDPGLKLTLTSRSANIKWPRYEFFIEPGLSKHHAWKEAELVLRRSPTQQSQLKDFTYASANGKVCTRVKNFDFVDQ